jgi:hypothetical protein
MVSQTFACTFAEYFSYVMLPKDTASGQCERHLHCTKRSAVQVSTVVSETLTCTAPNAVRCKCRSAPGDLALVLCFRRSPLLWMIINFCAIETPAEYSSYCNTAFANAFSPSRSSRSSHCSMTRWRPTSANPCNCSFT